MAYATPSTRLLAHPSKATPAADATPGTCCIRARVQLAPCSSPRHFLLHTVTHALLCRPPNLSRRRAHLAQPLLLARGLSLQLLLAWPPVLGHGAGQPLGLDPHRPAMGLRQGGAATERSGHQQGPPPLLSGCPPALSAGKGARPWACSCQASKRTCQARDARAATAEVGPTEEPCGASAARACAAPGQWQRPPHIPQTPGAGGTAPACGEPASALHKAETGRRRQQQGCPRLWVAGPEHQPRQAPSDKC